MPEQNNHAKPDTERPPDNIGGRFQCGEACKKPVLYLTENESVLIAHHSGHRKPLLKK
jgi:hypothetical protein